MRILFLAILFSMVQVVNLRADETKTVQEYYETGIQYLRKGEYDLAVENLAEAYALQPTLPILANALGVAHMRQGSYPDDALMYFQKAVELNPQFADAYANLGIFYTSYHHDIKLAKEYFKKALELDSLLSSANFGLGWILLTEEQNSREAVKLFEQAVRGNLNSSEAYYGLGLAYIAQKNNALALKPISKLRFLKRDDLALKLEAMLSGATESQAAATSDQGAPQGSEHGFDEAVTEGAE